MIHDSPHNLISAANYRAYAYYMLQLRTLNDKMLSSRPGETLPGDNRCIYADRVARVVSCVGLSNTAKYGSPGESAATARFCINWQGARGAASLTDASLRRNQQWYLQHAAHFIGQVRGQNFTLTVSGKSFELPCIHEYILYVIHFRKSRS